MHDAIQDTVVDSAEGMTLLGGGELGMHDLKEALSLAPVLVAADSGAAAALAEGRMPRAVIGDMDSLAPADRARLAPGVLHPVPEQDSTDFEKVLDRIRTPFAIGLGFLGHRVDHQLANFTALVRRPGARCLLVGPRDVVFAAPPACALDLAPETRVSLYPLAPVTGASEGLSWPIGGLDFAPEGRVGTSNRVAGAHAGPVRLQFDAPGMLVILPRSALRPALAAMRAAPPWPAPARGE
jgi:thiamine pyrophosphokinase